MHTDVLVVGAGPTGLMLANQLARQGVRVMIIDRHSGPAQQTRAMAVHARTLEIYSKMGIVDRALELGRRGNGANMWAEGQWTARIPLGEIGKGVSPFPYVLMLGQDDNERILGDRLASLGVDIQWNTELVSMARRSDGMLANLKWPDGSVRTIEASYVAGCDGGRSKVREHCGITFPGAPYEHVFFVADTEATGAMVAEELNVYLWRDGFHLFFPMHGKDRWRVIGILPKRLRGRDDLSFDDLVPEIKREAGMNLSFQSCSWFSTYRIHHRCADRFQDGRCFVLGDAAHVHSPMGGQGMNTGLQDAYNLAWKLALVIKGQADPTLLDSYAHERRQVARTLLGTTDRAFNLLVSDHRLAGFFRTRIAAKLAAFAMTKERSRKLAFRTLSQTGIRYPDSPLSASQPGLPEAAPAAGDRFPWLHLRLEKGGPVVDLYKALDDTVFNLIVIGQPSPAHSELDVSSMVHTVKVPDDAENRAVLDRAHIGGAAFFLLRPDGHVGLAGTRLEPAMLTRYFAERRIHVQPEKGKVAKLNLWAA